MKHWKMGLGAVLLSATAWSAPLAVVSSFSILGDVAKQIGGDKVAVSSLVGPNQDAHAYQMNSSDLKKIRSAKLVLLNGLGFEPAELQCAAEQSGVRIGVASKGIHPLVSEEAHDDHEEHGHDHGGSDPHVWNDPVLMQYYAANVAIALIYADPANREAYRHGFERYSQALLDLDAYARQQFGAVPAEKRKVLTGHDAFNYMAKRYGIQFIAPQGVSSEAEPSARQVAAIIRQIKQQNIKAVFAENIKDTRMVARIAQETGRSVGGSLYSDALSAGAPADTYLNLYRYNVAALSTAMR